MFDRSCRAAFVAVIALLVASCGGENDGPPLPEKWDIPPNGNLYIATGQICGTNPVDEKGRGRWRRWGNVNEDVALAMAKMKKDPDWGWVPIIQPGEYNVPRDLCQDEAGTNWLVIVGLLVGLLVVGFVLYIWRPWQPANPTPRPDFSTLRGHQPGR